MNLPCIQGLGFCVLPAHVSEQETFHYLHVTSETLGPTLLHLIGLGPTCCVVIHYYIFLGRNVNSYSSIAKKPYGGQANTTKNTADC